MNELTYLVLMFVVWGVFMLWLTRRVMRDECPTCLGRGTVGRAGRLCRTCTGTGNRPANRPASRPDGP